MEFWVLPKHAAYALDAKSGGAVMNDFGGGMLAFERLEHAAGLLVIAGVCVAFGYWLSWLGRP
jgi:hypothetical protein